MHVQPPQTRDQLCTAVILFNWAHLIGCKCKAAACIVCVGAKKSLTCSQFKGVIICIKPRHFFDITKDVILGSISFFCQTKLINWCLSTSTQSNFIRSTPHNTYTHLHTWLTCSIWLSVDCWLWSMPFFLDVAAILSLVLSSHFWMISFLFICDCL